MPLNKFYSFRRNSVLTLIVTIGFFLSQTNLRADCVYLAPIKAVELQVGNMITWVTVSEQNNDKFIIHKSTDGISFEKIGEINGAVNSNEMNRYRYLDSRLGNKKLFYKIVQLDKSGKSNQLPMVILQRENENIFALSGMSSTVTAGPLNLTIRSLQSGKLEAQIKSKGDQKLIEKTTFEIVDGANIVSLYLGHQYPLGTYDVELTMNQETEIILIEKVKETDAPVIHYAVKEQ